MKKFLVPIIMVVALAFASCSASSAKLGDVYAKIKSEVKLTDMIELDEKSDFDNYYGISEKQLDEFAGGINNTGVEQEEIVLTKASDESSAKEIETALVNRRDAKLNENKNYNPKQAEMIEKCKVEKHGLYVFMVISPNKDKINEILKSEIGY